MTETIVSYESETSVLRRRRSAVTSFLFSRQALGSKIIILLIVLGAIFAELLAAHGPNEQLRQALLQPPAWISGDWSLPFGTDDLGRDLWARMLVGARTSLVAGICMVVLAAVVGTAIGIISGVAGEMLDFAIMRVVDVLLSIPAILLGIAVIAALGPSMVTAIVAVALIQVPPFIRLTRALIRAELSKDYVHASRLAGEGPLHLLFVSVLPNCLAPLIVQSTLSLSDAILQLAAFGFLGMGAQPPTAEWGTMVADGLPFLESAWWIVTFPGVAIFLSVLSLNLLGDHLRDVLDPRHERI